MDRIEDVAVGVEKHIEEKTKVDGNNDEALEVVEVEDYQVLVEDVRMQTKNVEILGVKGCT